MGTPCGNLKGINGLKWDHPNIIQNRDLFGEYIYKKSWKTASGGVTRGLFLNWNYFCQYLVGLWWNLLCWSCCGSLFRMICWTASPDLLRNYGKSWVDKGGQLEILKVTMSQMASLRIYQQLIFFTNIRFVRWELVCHLLAVLAFPSLPKRPL